MDPQTVKVWALAPLLHYCVYSVVLFWQVVIHPRMKLKMMLSKLLYVQISFL